MPPGKNINVVIAGGGIGGLCTALVLKKQGCQVQVFEKASQYRPFGGPIQIASNAAESLKRIDRQVYAKILQKSTIIGDRVNGLKDGVSNEWFATFDLKTPAASRDQVSSVVIDRPVLQEILLSEVGDVVSIGTEVIGFQRRGDGVVVELSSGVKVDADLLVGSDGIRSRVRDILDPRGSVPPTWSGYTCFAGMAKCVPSDIKDVGYKVWLGPRKYFVSVDVGGGRIQWYAFLNIQPGSLSLVSGKESLEYLRSEQFHGWSNEVHELIDSTADDDIEQRDLYDRPPQLKWVQGPVALLGDAAHPMMPNLGQGGGMAIEDALVLGQELQSINYKNDLSFALKRYNDNRALRAASVQGLSRLSSSVLFAYSHPTSFKDGKLQNLGLRSVITRACQGFLQRVAFPLQFEYLFSFPGPVDPLVFEDQRRPGDFVSREGMAMSVRKTEGKVGAAERELVTGKKNLGDWLAQYW